MSATLTESTTADELVDGMRVLHRIILPTEAAASGSSAAETFSSDPAGADAGDDSGADAFGADARRCETTLVSTAVFMFSTSVDTFSCSWSVAVCAGGRTRLMICALIARLNLVTEKDASATLWLIAVAIFVMSPVWKAALT